MTPSQDYWTPPCNNMLPLVSFHGNLHHHPPGGLFVLLISYLYYWCYITEHPVHKTSTIQSTDEFCWKLD